MDTDTLIAWAGTMLAVAVGVAVGSVFFENTLQRLKNETTNA